MSVLMHGRLRCAVLGAATATTLLFTPGAFAGEPDEKEQDVTVQLRGGDAEAISDCVELTLEDEAWHDRKKSDARKKREYAKWRRAHARQLNACDTLAEAVAGGVKLYDVTISIDQLGDGSYERTEQDVDLIMRGGDAIAVAACGHMFNSGDAPARQENTCQASAFADGGDVTLTKVDIEIFSA